MFQDRKPLTEQIEIPQSLAQQVNDEILKMEKDQNKEMHEKEIVKARPCYQPLCLVTKEYQSYIKCVASPIKLWGLNNVLNVTFLFHETRYVKR